MRRPAWTALAIALLLGLGEAVPATAGQSTDALPGRVLVMPFENQTRDATISWLGEASAVLVADDVTAFGGNAITRAERLQAFERLQVPSGAVLTDATVIRIAQIVGAAEVVVGSIQLETRGLVVRARSIAIEAGRVQADVTERGPLPDLMAIFDRVSRGVARTAAPATGPAQDRPPVAAFEAYIRGLLADTPSAAVTYLNAALTLHPRYDRARLALWDAFTEDGDDQRALAAVQAVPPASVFSRRARFLAGLSQLSLRGYDAAFSTFQALAADESTPTVLNNLGVVQLRRGGTPQTGAATFYFDKAAQADPDDPDYFFNLGYAYWQERDTPATIYWLREAVRRSPTDGAAHFILGTALAAAGSLTESVREKELARRLSSTYEQWEKRPAGDQIPKGLERLKSEVELPHARRIETRVAAATGQRDQQDLATFYLDRARRLFQQERDREAEAELDRALFLSPYLAEAHLLSGRLHLRGGRVREAIDALKISVWSSETAEAHAVLGEAYRQAKELDAARVEAERAMVLDPSSVDAKQLVAMLRSP